MLQIVDKCGHPKLADQSDAQVAVAPHSDSDIKSEPFYEEDESAGDMYARLETFMRSLMASKGFYHSLGDTMCSAEKFATGLDQDNCWNGHTLAK